MQSETMLLTLLGLSLASIIEFFIAFFLLKKDIRYRANQLLSLAFISLGFTILINMIYLSIELPDSEIILFHQLTNMFAIIFGIFLFATVSFIRFGNNGFKQIYFLLINAICLILILGLFLYEGLDIYYINNAPQFTWDLTYLIIASLPIFLLGSSSVYYFYKLYTDLREEENVSKQLKMSIVAYTLITLAYFVSRLPFYLIKMNPDLQSSAQLIALIASIFVVIFSILIAEIFLQRKPTEPTNS
jgi:hypothetical protein